MLERNHWRPDPAETRKLLDNLTAVENLDIFVMALRRSEGYLRWRDPLEWDGDEAGKTTLHLFYIIRLQLIDS